MIIFLVQEVVAGKVDKREGGVRGAIGERERNSRGGGNQTKLISFNTGFSVVYLYTLLVI